MPKLSDTEFFVRMKKGDIVPVYCFYGKEVYLIQKAVGAVRQAVVKSFAPFNCNRLDGESCGADAIEDAALTLPVMAERKCVLVKNLRLDKMSRAELERLEKLASEPPETAVILFYFTRELQNAKEKALAAAIEKQGRVVCFPFKERGDIAALLSAQAKKRGCVLSKEAGLYLTQRCGNQLSLLMNEMEKLASYAAGREITKKDIDAVTVKSIEATAFDLARAILQNDYDQAFSILDELFYMNVEKVAVIGALNSAFTDIYRAKAALAAGKDAKNLAGDFADYKGRAFRASNAFRDCRRFSKSQIARCLRILLEADLKLKSMRTDDRIIVEQAVACMMLAAAGKTG